MTWQLFVDESGDFTDREQTVLVGGLMVEGESILGDADFMAGALCAALPDIPYPHHGWLCTQRAYLALTLRHGRAHPRPPRVKSIAPHEVWSRATPLARTAIERLGRGQLLGAGEANAVHGLYNELEVLAPQTGHAALGTLVGSRMRQSLPVSLPEELEQAVTLMRQRAPGAVRRAQEAIAAGREPTWDDLDACDRALANSPARRAIDTVRDAVGSTMRRLLQIAFRPVPCDSLAAFALGSEARQGQAAGSADRYLTLLEGLLAHLDRTLARSEAGQPAKVRLFVLTRNARVDGGEKRMTSELLQHLVSQWAQGHRFEVAAVSDFRPDVDPLLVLADWACLFARRTLLRRRHGLAQVEDRLGRHGVERLRLGASEVLVWPHGAPGRWLRQGAPLPAPRAKGDEAAWAWDAAHGWAGPLHEASASHAAASRPVVQAE